MKEISIEEKAKCYDKALAKAKNIVNSINVGLIGKDSFEAVFPELKESEDEKIRKALLESLNYTNPWDFLNNKGIVKGSIVAWLEKQGNNINCIYDKELSELLHIVICRYVNDPVIPYSERENVSKKLFPYVKLLEKQGEQKFYTSETMNEKRDFDSGFTRMMENKQKPADKVEPKFKVGDWVVHNMSDGRKSIRQIVEMTNKSYVLDGGCFDAFYFNDLENDYHLWTIQDANDGDVLSYATDEEDLWIMIYRSLYEPYEGHIHYHALLVNNNFSDKGTCFISIDNLKPATKEQRNLLFQKMTDAGYTFDFDKKELKKIIDEKQIKKNLQDNSFRRMFEQKTVWSKEDETKINYLIALLQNSTMNHDALRVMNEEVENWLKFLKDRYTWKPSDEQIWCLSDAVKRFPVPKLKELLDDLKKLKG